VIAKAMYVLRPVFYARQADWRQTESLQEGELPGRTKEESTGNLAPIESWIFQ
jgi:hypothetical protein